MYFQKLNLPEPIFNLGDIIIPEAKTALYERHIQDVPKIMPVDLLEKLKSIDMVPEYARLFVWPTNYCGIWHIDGTSGFARNISFNWIIKGSGVIQFNNTVKMLPRAGLYQGWQGKLEDTYDVETDGHGCLINTAVGHRVVTKDDGRVILTLNYKSKDVPFEVMLEKLNSIGLI